LISLRNLWWS